MESTVVLERAERIECTVLDERSSTAGPPNLSGGRYGQADQEHELVCTPEASLTTCQVGQLNLADSPRPPGASAGYRLPVSTPVEETLRTLWELLQRAQTWEERIDAGPEAAQVQQGSALADDDALTQPFHLSHSAWHALIVAVDHTRCLRWALNAEVRDGQVQFRMGTHSPGTVLRGAIENGARAVWLLKPDARSRRVAHRLSLEIYEYEQAKQLWKVIGRSPADHHAHRNQVRELVRAARLPAADADAAGSFPGYGGLVWEAGGDAAVAAWRACSSLAHGDSRGANLLTRETVDARDGILTVRIRGLSVGLLGLLTDVAMALIDRGFTRYEQLARAAPAAPATGRDGR